MAKSDWHEVDVTRELTPETRKLYIAAKEQYQLYAQAKRDFEAMMQLDYEHTLAEDEELKFGYNFGKLAIAVGEKRERKPRKSVEAKPSLGDWLKARQSEGRDC